jgi:hypothetical protein
MSVVGCIVGQMTPLAPGAKVTRVVVLRRVIEMGDGQHNAASGDRMGLGVFGSATGISWGSFAAIPRTVKNRRPYVAAPV